MRLWVNLSWYELATVATARGACCDASTSTPMALPPSIGTCASLATVLEGLSKAVRARADVDKAVDAFRDAALCIARGNRVNVYLESPYDYEGDPDGGSASAYRKILEKAVPK
jgi:hypothetical protein